MSSLAHAIAAIGLAATPAGAAQPPTAPSQRPPTTVSPLTVTLKRVEGVDVVGSRCPTGRRESADPDATAPSREPPPPRVVDSFPAPGATIPPGPMTLRLTFDRPMNCGWSVVFGGGGAEPCRPVIAWNLPDRRTWRMRCDVRPGARYTVEFGGVRDHPFEGLSGAEAAPFELAFSTLSAPDQASAWRPGEASPTGATTGQLICGDQRRSQLDGCRVDRSGSDPFSSPP